MSTIKAFSRTLGQNSIDFEEFDQSDSRELRGRFESLGGGLLNSRVGKNVFLRKSSVSMV